MRCESTYSGFFPVRVPSQEFFICAAFINFHHLITNYTLGYNYLYLKLDFDSHIIPNKYANCIVCVCFT